MARGTAVAEEAADAPAKKADVKDITNNPLERTEVIRGVEFKLRELTQEEYDECSKMATGPNGFDSILLLKVMLTKALVEPKLNAEQIRALPFKVTNQLRATVNRMHWGEDEIREDDEGNESSSPVI